ncbi:unnamed protein product [Prunus armeniaca]
MKLCLLFCWNIENQESSANTSELEHIIEFDPIQVLLDAEFGIMGEKLGRRGRSIHGLKMLSINFVTLQKENEDLRAQLRSVLTASHGQTNTNSRGSNGVHSDNDYYYELANHNLDEN